MTVPEIYMNALSAWVGTLAWILRMTLVSLKDTWRSGAQGFWLALGLAPLCPLDKAALCQPSVHCWVPMKGPTGPAVEIRSLGACGELHSPPLCHQRIEGHFVHPVASPCSPGDVWWPVVSGGVPRGGSFPARSHQLAQCHLLMSS